MWTLWQWPWVRDIGWTHNYASGMWANFRTGAAIRLQLYCVANLLCLVVKFSDTVHSPCARPAQCQPPIFNPFRRVFGDRLDTIQRSCVGVSCDVFVDLLVRMWRVVTKGVVWWRYFVHMYVRAFTTCVMCD